MRSQILTAGLVAVLAAAGAAQQTSPASGRGDWPMYRHDLAGTGHSPLDLITPRNVGQLAPAWTYALGAAGALKPEPTIPLVLSAAARLPLG